MIKMTVSSFYHLFLFFNKDRRTKNFKIFTDFWLFVEKNNLKKTLYLLYEDDDVCF